MFNEDADFHYATDAEWDREAAREMGAEAPHRAWILTDRDVWYPNPFYRGPAVPHPESDPEEFDAEAANAKIRAVWYLDDMPF